MKYLKFFESNDVIDDISVPYSLKHPLYKRGEIIIWSKGNDVDYEFAKKLLNRLGLKLIGEPYDGGFLIQCESGKEIEKAKEVINRFPEFFDSYEREDIRQPYINDKVEEIIDDVNEIESFFESTLKKTVNTDLYNKHIDKIINKLTKLKIK